MLSQMASHQRRTNFLVCFASFERIVKKRSQLVVTGQMRITGQLYYSQFIRRKVNAVCTYNTYNIILVCCISYNIFRAVKESTSMSESMRTFER